jgi:hypothetical protein
MPLVDVTAARKRVASRYQDECQREGLLREERRSHIFEDGSSRMCGRTAFT